jgi:hypothetical protein
MTIDHRARMKFVSWALTLAMAATLATCAWAAEAGSQPSSDAKANNSETQSHEPSAADKNSAPASSGADTEDIDTRITVQPHGPAGKFGKAGGSANPIQPLKPVNAHRRTFSPSRAANRISPNASGVLNGQRQILQQGPGQHFESNGLRSTPAIGAAAGVGTANVGLAKPGSNLGREPISPSTGISPIGTDAKTFTRGGIGGASLNHRAVGPGTAAIGGPARTVTGINGTAIRATR